MQDNLKAKKFYPSLSPLIFYYFRKSDKIYPKCKKNY